MDDQIELQRQINASGTAQIPSEAWDCTTPIVIAHEGAVHHFGTGTLFRVANHFFLVTTGHVIKQACEEGNTLGIGGSDDGKFIVLTGDSFVSSEGQYGTSGDPLDIGLHRLAPEAVSRLKKRFLLFDDVEFAPQSPTGERPLGDVAAFLAFGSLPVSLFFSILLNFLARQPVPNTEGQEFNVTGHSSIGIPPFRAENLATGGG